MGGRADSLRDLFHGRVLEDVAAGAGEDRLEDVDVISRAADDEHPDRGAKHGEAFDRVDAAHLCQVDVHQHHVGHQVRNDLQGLLG